MEYKIPVSWEMYGYVKIEAESLEQALEIAIKTEDDLSLPDGDYVDGSFYIEEDMDVIESLNS